MTALFVTALVMSGMSGLLGLPGCGAELDGVPEGALARVGDQVVEQAQLEAVHGQLDAFGQARFRGAEGRRALLDALVSQELLVQAAQAAGLARDPRVEWAVIEELATLQRAAMLERRLPQAELAGDREALRARYARPEVRAQFLEPERRRMRVVRVETFDAGERALAQLAAGELTLEELGQVVRTPLMRRDDHEYPAFHQLVFDPALGVGDLVPRPVLSAQLVLIGEIDEIEPARVLPFEDPQVQEQLIAAERADRLAPVEAALLAELRDRFPGE